LQNSFQLCVQTFCNDDGTATIKTADGERGVKCKNENEIVNISDYQINCSNRTHICGVINF
jgi:hypothetical protein